MRLWVGTSGYSYKEWKGSFYPEKIAADEMLRYYGERLPAVEINNTFYRLPSESVLTAWAERVPEDFRFSIKASRRITHIKRLKNASDETTYLLRALAILGPRLGAVLFQLPPNLRKDLARLESFLDLIPEETPTAFEFRHQSWFDDEVLECLRSKGRALCAADTDEADPPAVIGTARWGYLRLRREEYSDTDLAHWANRVAGEGWKEAFVFFKHEEAGAGPRLAKRFLELL
ncbi:MAG: DUF72 domain-containing protein [Gemmatimonadota bacterium]